MTIDVIFNNDKDAFQRSGKEGNHALVPARGNGFQVHSLGSKKKLDGDLKKIGALCKCKNVAYVFVTLHLIITHGNPMFRDDNDRPFPALSICKYEFETQQGLILFQEYRLSKDGTVRFLRKPFRFLTGKFQATECLQAGYDK